MRGWLPAACRSAGCQFVQDLQRRYVFKRGWQQLSVLGLRGQHFLRRRRLQLFKLPTGHDSTYRIGHLYYSKRRCCAAGCLGLPDPSRLFGRCYRRFGLNRPAAGRLRKRSDHHGPRHVHFERNLCERCIR